VQAHEGKKDVSGKGRGGARKEEEVSSPLRVISSVGGLGEKAKRGLFQEDKMVVDVQKEGLRPVEKDVKEKEKEDDNAGKGVVSKDTSLVHASSNMQPVQDSEVLSGKGGDPTDKTKKRETFKRMARPRIGRKEEKLSMGDGDKRSVEALEMDGEGGVSMASGEMVTNKKQKTAGLADQSCVSK
jgi:hypothetical protein